MQHKRSRFRAHFQRAHDAAGKRKCSLCDVPVLVCLECCDGRRDKKEGVMLKCDLCVEQGEDGGDEV